MKEKLLGFARYAPLGFFLGLATAILGTFLINQPNQHLYATVIALQLCFFAGANLMFWGWLWYEGSRKNRGHNV